MFYICRGFQSEQAELEEEIKLVESQVTATRAETARKLKELNEARVAQKVRQSQIMRLACLSRPIDHDTTYFVSDKNIAMYGDSNDDAEGFMQKYIKLAKSGELIQLESKYSESSGHVSKSLSRLAAKLSETHKTKASAFFAESHRHKRAEELLRILEKLELQNYYLVKEYLKLRLNVMVIQREEAEAREDVEKCYEMQREEEILLKKELSVGVQSIKSRYDKELRIMQNQLDKQLASIMEKSDQVQLAKVQVESASAAIDQSLMAKYSELKAR